MERKVLILIAMAILGTGIAEAGYISGANDSIGFTNGYFTTMNATNVYVNGFAACTAANGLCNFTGTGALGGGYNTSDGTWIYNGTSGLTLNLTSANNTFQRSLYNCTNSGSYIYAVNPNGSVYCDTDDTGAGDITGVSTYDPYLLGGAESGAVNLSVNESALNDTIVARALAALGNATAQYTNSSQGGQAYTWANANHTNWDTAYDVRNQYYTNITTALGYYTNASLGASYYTNASQGATAYGWGYYGTNTSIFDNVDHFTGANAQNMNLTGKNLTISNIIFDQDTANHQIYDNSSCIVLKAGSTILEVCE